MLPRGGSIVVAIAFPTHRYLNAVLAQDLLIVVRSVLATAIRMMNVALGWLPERNCHLQDSDREIALHTIAHGPTDHPSRMQAQDHSEVQPAFTRPDIADVASPLLVWCISVEVTVQQVRCDIELMITVPLLSYELGSSSAKLE